MNVKFGTVEAVNRLLYHAAQWKGTPWRANSCAKGSGVACHNLPRALYVECGALPEDFPQVEGTPNDMKHLRVSMMEKFLDGRPEFERLSRDLWLPETGDLLGFAIGPCVNHLGVLLGSRSFVHVLMKKNVCVDSLADPTWATRLKSVWRIK